jgi:hypothetical protein
LRLIDYLSVPYRLEAATTELADGSWVRRSLIRAAGLHGESLC